MKNATSRHNYLFKITKNSKVPLLSYSSNNTGYFTSMLEANDKISYFPFVLA